MNQKVALRIVQSAGTVDFYDNEIPDADVQILHHYQVQENAATQPIIRSEGEDWAVLQVKILATMADTVTKVKAVLNDNDEKTVYYAMLTDPGKYITALLLPEHSEFAKYSGNTVAEHGYTLTFLECD